MASTFLSVATAVPDHALEPAEAQRLLETVFPRLALARKPDGSDSAESGTRFMAEPPTSLLAPRGLGDAMQAYAVHAQRLANEACGRALDQAGLAGRDVDAVISVSCTGYMVPSLDVYLAPTLGLRADVVRLPITELGCSGGAAALACAHRYLVAYPAHRVLVVAVELPSLTFQPGDRSLDNLTASMVFGDGAGAAILTGSAHAEHGLRVESVAAHLVPNSTAALGYDLKDGGFHIVLDRRLPRLVGDELGSVVRGFCAGAGMERVDFVAAHGGGPKILDAVERSLGLPPGIMTISRETYRRVGNVSSASILFTLEAIRCRLGPRPAQGLGLGLGPGVSIELMHLAWNPAQNTPGMNLDLSAKSSR